MDSEFTDEQIGKRVVGANGTDIGVVKAVRRGTLHVEVGPDANPKTLDELGWTGIVHQSVHRLPGRYIADITDEVVRLSV